MYSPPLHITLQKDSTSWKTALIIRVANWMIEKTAIGGRVMVGWIHQKWRKIIIKLKNAGVPMKQ